MKYRLGALLGVILLVGCQSSVVDLSTTDIAIPTEKPTFIYLINMNSHHMVCGNMINQMPQLDNTSSVTGDIMTGFNVTAFLQPGENTLDARVASINAFKENDGDGSVQRADGECKLVFTANPQHGQPIELSSLNITVDDGKATAKTSKEYPPKYRTDVAKIMFHQKGWTSYISRPIYIKTIPQWAWTKAEPFKPTRENMKKLHRAYQALIDMMKRHDIQGLKDAYSLSSREKSLAEAGQSSPDEFFDATEIEAAFSAKGVQVVDHQSWGNYELKTYANGRLVQLVDKNDNSPLVMTTDDSSLPFLSLLPYFSIINGRVVISR
ncbi:glycosyl hydrolase family 26 [Celerinatantimonas sp. MCCC 1A17872]|uniref:glycosyl hydrolase family 26 n=1 Tax=Celerinatantimonas sp. MCCC 1A17872 TaxID=3177514 RepID=UPI0038C4464C